MQIVTVSRPSLQQSLGKHLDEALQGRESVCLVTGDPGSGKTQLIQQFAREAQADRSDLLVAYSACNAITGFADAYMPFREILQQLSGDVDESLAEGTTHIGNVSRLRRFMLTSARALAEHGPDLVDVFVPGGALMTRLGSKVAQRWDWFSKLKNQVNTEKPRHINLNIRQDNIFEQYTRVIEAISEKTPLLLIVDDLHWADRASLSLLFQLARRLVNNQVLIIAATRTPDKSAEMFELNNMLNELRRYFGEIVLDLSNPPGEEFIKAYLDAAGIPSDRTTIDTLEELTGGNPLFVVELLRQHIEGDTGAPLPKMDVSQFPARLSGVLDRQFGALDDDDQHVLATASVQGNVFWAELLADVHDDTLISIVRRLSGTLQRGRHIVVDAGPLELASGTVSQFRFRHDLLREYVYQSLTENERRVLHKVVAAQIESRTINAAETYCLVLADHFEKAHSWTKALRYRVMGAERTERACAPFEAASHYATAIETCARITPVPADSLFDLRLRLASQLSLAGDFPGAKREARVALDSATAADQISTAWLAVGRICEQGRDLAEALDALEQAESVLLHPEDPGVDSGQKIDILLQRALINYLQRDRAALAITNRALEMLIEEYGEPQQRVSYFNSRSRQELADSRFSPHGDAAVFSQRALESSQTPTSATIFGFAFAKLWQEQFEESIAHFEKSRSEAILRGDSVVQLQALVYLSIAQRRLGNVAAVESLVAQISDLLEFVKVAEYPAVLLAQRGWLAYRRGDTDNASALAQSASQGWLDLKLPYPFCWIADWVIFAIAAPGSSKAFAAANKMLLPNQAWQRDIVTAALKSYSSSKDVTDEDHDEVVEMARRELYL